MMSMNMTAMTIMMPMTMMIKIMMIPKIEFVVMIMIILIKVPAIMMMIIIITKVLIIMIVNSNDNYYGNCISNINIYFHVLWTLPLKAALFMVSGLTSLQKHSMLYRGKCVLLSQVFELWLGVSKGMLPVKYFRSNKASFCGS